MKKGIICCLLAMSMMLTACGKSEGQNDIKNGVKASAENTAADDFINVYSGEKVYLEYVDNSGSEVIEAYDFSEAETRVYMESNIMGFVIISMTNEDGTYEIDNENETYRLLINPKTGESFGASDELKESLIKSCKKTGAGEGIFDGAECSYCEYDITTFNGESGVYKLYYKDGAVIGTEDSDGEINKILKYSTEVPEGMFAVPDGYTKA